MVRKIICFWWLPSYSLMSVFCFLLRMCCPVSNTCARKCLISVSYFLEMWLKLNLFVAVVIWKNMLFTLLGLTRQYKYVCKSVIQWILLNARITLMVLKGSLLCFFKPRVVLRDVVFSRVWIENIQLKDFP